MANAKTPAQSTKKQAAYKLLPYLTGKAGHLAEFKEKGTMPSTIAAREYDKATQPLGQAASLHENGDLYVRLAEVLMQREKWPEAQDALQRALDKGKLKDTGNTKLLMGIAVYSQDKPKEARTWFQQASEYPNEKKAALGWLQHIDSEQNSGR